MNVPHLHQPQTLEEDSILIGKILQGSQQDLEALIVRHQGWIYNIALKMTMDPHDAEDVTQEILIKLITKLATYSAQRGSFRTWLYRIVAHHVINMKKRKYEKLFSSFDECEAAAVKLPDDAMDASPEALVLVEELKIKCLTGLLLCLNRKQRLIFIMSEIFDVGNAEGSEIMEVSEVAYRQTLSRARKKVYHFINQNCGLIHPDNPCHCNNKLKGFIRIGFVDPANLLFYKHKVKTIQETIGRNKQALHQFYSMDSARLLYKEHPFYDPPEFEKRIANLLKADGLSLLASEILHQ
ncbi:MAG: RNA polymerase sigma factor [Desulfatitalea sp.]